MKVLFALISILLLSFIYSDEKCEGKAEKKSDCHDIKLSNEKKCCYFSYKYTDEDGQEKESTGCTDIEKTEYNDIDKYIEDIEKKNEDEKLKLKSLDCNSYYLHITILSLLFILI